MLTGYWNVLQSNFALMPSSNFYWISFSWWNHMHASFLFRLLSLINSLQNHVWPVRPLYRNHLNLELLPNDHSWVRMLADFTLELVKVVCFDNSDNFLLHFTINPLFQTFCMNECTWALALAWRNDKILFLIIIAKTYLTRALNFLIGLKNSIEFAKEDVFQDLFVFTFG